MQIYHIIGTDTGVGKTTCCCQLMQFLAAQNKTVATLKPIASGLCQTELGLINEDIARLISASNLRLKPIQINLFNYPQPIAPHIAAKLIQQELNLSEISDFILKPLISADYLLVEGIGGVMVPLNDSETYLDLLNQLQQPIILVVGMKLGCLNHALLTAASLIQRNLNFVGWIANQSDAAFTNYAENLSYLQNKLSAPLIAEINHSATIQIHPQFTRIFSCY